LTGSALRPTIKGNTYEIHTNLALVTAGFVSLLLAGCGQKEASPPPADAVPIAAAPHDDKAASEASPHVDAAPHAEGGDAHAAPSEVPAKAPAPAASNMPGMDMKK
jgi:hypothetical protein